MQFFIFMYFLEYPSKMFFLSNLSIQWKIRRDRTTDTRRSTGR